MPQDPLMYIMLALIAVMIFFMFRNNKKRQKAMQEMQDNMRPGAEIMLQSGIFGTVVSVDSEENRVTIESGTSTLVVHRNAISQIVSAADAAAEKDTTSVLAPDDDPAFGERVAGSEAGEGGTAPEQAPSRDAADTDDSNGGGTPKA